MYLGGMRCIYMLRIMRFEREKDGTIWVFGLIVWICIFVMFDFLRERNCKGFPSSIPLPFLTRGLCYSCLKARYFVLVWLARKRRQERRASVIMYLMTKPILPCGGCCDGHSAPGMLD